MAHLHTIGLENFRLFRERTQFDFAPITILTGPNSSGKSSLMKAFQLLKENSTNQKYLDSLDSLSGDHGLGYFDDILNYNSKSNYFKIYFDLDCSKLLEEFKVKGITKSTIELNYYVNREKENVSSSRLEEINILADSGSPFLSMIKGSNDYDESTMFIKIDLDFLSKNLVLEGEEKLNNSSFLFFPQKNEQPFIEKYQDYLKYIKDHGITHFLGTTIQEFEMIDQRFTYYISKLAEDLKSHIRLNFEGFEIQFTKLGDKLFGSDNEQKKSCLFYGLDKEIQKSLNRFGSIYHISSFNFRQKRVYFSSDVEFEIVQSIPNKRFVKKWLKLFDIGDDIEIDPYKNFALEVFIKKDGQSRSLANLGYGMTKLVHIILKVAQTANDNHLDIGPPSQFFGNYPECPYSPSVILLEEPEANLHPSFQSKIAELIIDAYQEFNIQFLIETHSEYLIRNLQYLTATKKIKSDDSKIYYFHQQGTNDFKKSPYREIEIMQDGRLSNEFGEGFFDEIPRLLAFLYNSSFN